MGVRDRAVGSVLGLALGDALGAPFAHRRAARVPKPLPAFELEWMGLPPGTTTDDTAMARNLVRSLVEREGLDTDDVLARHIAWLESGPPDVGNLTRSVLSRAAEGAPNAACEYVDRRGPEVSADNGSVMYCAPLGVAYAFRPDALFDLAPALSALTHWDERCRTACLAVTLAAAGLVRGERGDRAVIDAVTTVSDRKKGGEELEYLVEAAGRARPVDGPDRGFTLFAAGLALQLAAEESPFEDGLRHVVGLGGDTDTNAAVAGALLGALHGRSGLPVAWLDRLRDRDEIEAEADALAKLTGRWA